MSKKTNVTRSQLVSLAKSVSGVIERWEAANTDEAPHVVWRGRPTKAISEAMVESFEEMFGTVSTLDIDVDAHAIALAIDAFNDRYDEWAEQSELSPEMTSPSGSPEMWSTWRELITTLADRPVRSIESIAQLDIEKVGDRQIALIYGWAQSDGSPDIQKVREERANPGTHFDKSKWVHPQDAADAAEVAARWSQRSLRIAASDAMGEASMAPETLDDLIRQDVSSKQIAMMLNIEVAEVKERARLLNIPIDGQFVPSVSPHDRMQDIRDADQDRKRKLHQAASQAEMRAAETDPATMAERILSLAADGQKPKQIVRTLASDFSDLTEAKVAGILAHAEKAESIEV